MPDVVSHDNCSDNRWYGAANNCPRPNAGFAPPVGHQIPDYSPVSVCNPAHLAGLRLGTYIIGFPNFQTLVPGDESWWIRTV